jgi:two-component system, response regulator PdtaR
LNKQVDKQDHHILIVDDDPVVLAALAMGLTSMGFNVERAASGEEAVLKCAQLHPDIAILDINMPGMSGIEAARQIRETSGVPVLFLTAYDEQELVKQAVAEGGLGYLIKPIRVKQLVPAIQTALARAQERVGLENRQKNLSQALESDRNTNVAMGILMERNHLGKDEAFQALRARARSEGRKITDVAQELVSWTENANSFGVAAPAVADDRRKKTVVTSLERRIDK